MIKELKEYIKKEGLKKAKVAELLDCSAGHLSYILSETRTPSILLEGKIRELIK